MEAASTQDIEYYRYRFHAKSVITHWVYWCQQGCFNFIHCEWTPAATRLEHAGSRDGLSPSKMRKCCGNRMLRVRAACAFFLPFPILLFASRPFLLVLLDVWRDSLALTLVCVCVCLCVCGVDGVVQCLHLL